MIEKTIRDYLAAISNIPVYTELPADYTRPCIVIEKTGGSIENYIKSATVAIQVYGNSLYEAVSYNETLIEDMLKIITLNDIASCRLNSTYNYTDTTTKEYRYQSVFNITYY